MRLIESMYCIRPLLLTLRRVLHSHCVLCASFRYSLFYQQSKLPFWPLGPAVNVCHVVELMYLARKPGEQKESA